MDFSINKENICICTCIFNQNVEYPLDFEMILPDYCSDIARVLKCTAEAKIISKEAQEKSYKIEGELSVNIIYIDPNDYDIHSYSFTHPFTKEIEHGDISPQTSGNITAYIDRISCRMLTARKADIHSVIILKTKLFNTNETPAVLSAENIGLECRKTDFESSTTLLNTEKHLNINEDIDLPDSMKAICSIIRCETAIKNAECRTVGEKAVVKGDLAFKIVYSTDTKMRIEKYEDSIPFSQVIDLDENVDNVECIPQVEVSSFEIRPRTGMDGECHSIILSARLQISLNMETLNTKELLTDAYSTSHDIEIIKQNAAFIQKHPPFKETFVCKKKTSIPDETAAILDIWCENENSAVKFIESLPTIYGNVKICILACDNDSNIFFTEQTVDYTYEYTEKLPDQCELTPNITAETTGFTMNGKDEIEVRIALTVTAQITQTVNVAYISDIQVNGEKNTLDTSPLVLCYTDAGEDLWNIARHYSTTVDAIKSANDVDSDILNENRMLLIPSV